MKSFEMVFGVRPTRFYSSPGRTELGGNHTDHNRGKVLAAAVDLDMKAEVVTTERGAIRVYSEDLGLMFEVSIGDLAVRNDEQGTSGALIRGMADRFARLGFPVSGFDARILSRVAVGSGLSSSACFEVLIGTIMNDVYAENKLSPGEVARAGQRAENEYFGKPCGLMDQLTCAVGGTIRIDFNDPSAPDIRRVTFNPRDQGFDLVVVNTGSDHADLTAKYASIPGEMRSVARFFGKENCRDIHEELLLDRLNEVRKSCGDRAVLRCLHFLEENKRVDRQFEALQQKNFAGFLREVQGSGDSSIKWLQNIFSEEDPRRQDMTLALALADRFLAKAGRGAYRIHGGGFAGTIQVYLPAESREEFSHMMDRVFGEHCVLPIAVRPAGASRLEQTQALHDP